MVQPPSLYKLAASKILNNFRDKLKSNIPIDQKKIVKMSNSLDIRTLKDLNHGLDELIYLIKQFND